MKWFLITCLWLPIFHWASAQDLVFEKSFSSSDYFVATSLVEMDNGGFLISGFRRMPDQLIRNFLIKTDENGDTLWTKPLKYYSEFFYSDIIKTDNGSYTFGGTVRKTPGASEEVYVANFDENGNLNWDNSFNIGFGTFVCQEIKELSKGEYILAVGSPPFTIGSADAGFLVKLNALGDTLWSRKFDYMPNAPFLPTDVIATNDGGFMLTGTGNGGLRLIKTNSTGNKQWEKFYDHISDDVVSVVEDNNGDFVICSVSDSIASTANDIYLLRINNQGERIWSKFIGAAGDDYGFKILKDETSQGFVITGTKAIDGHQKSQVYFAKINASGDIICENSFGPDSAFAYDITPTADGNWAIIGGVNFLLTSDLKSIFLYKVSDCKINTVKDQHSSGLISVYPNPAHSLININNLPPDKELKVEIFNLNGKIILSKNVNAQNKNVPVNNLREGLYFLRITSEHGRIYSTMIRIQD